MSSLNKDFLTELFKLCLLNRNIVSVCKEKLEFHFLPTEPYKELWKVIRGKFILDGDLYTIGKLSQMFTNDKEVLKLLSDIKECSIPNENDILLELESYIIDSMSADFGEKYVELWNKGKKQEARELHIKCAQDINTFTLKANTTYFEPIFGGFAQRQMHRDLKKAAGENLKVNTVFGIDELDERFDGGLRLTDMALVLAQSGIGKSTLLRHIGISNARRGFKVLHIQLEGAKEEAELMFDSGLTGQKPGVLEFGDLDPDIYNEVINSVDLVNYYGGEIYLEAYEEFGTATCVDVNNRVDDFIKIHGVPPDLILIDYYELLDPGDGKHYSTGVEGEKARRKAIGRSLKNICTSKKTRIIVPTQGSTITPEEKNDPDFHMTRYNISGDKAQLDAFTIFMTLNQTNDEYHENKMRVWVDKARKVKGGFVAEIYGDYDHGRFYDRVKTMKVVHNKDI